MQVWWYLDPTYMRQDVFMYNLMKPIYAHKKIGEKNYRGLEDLRIRYFSNLYYLMFFEKFSYEFV
jgi:hypothetical protein